MLIWLDREGMIYYVQISFYYLPFNLKRHIDSVCWLRFISLSWTNTHKPKYSSRLAQESCRFQLASLLTIVATIFKHLVASWKNDYYKF